MTLTELQSQISLGEDSRRQFKRDVTNVDSLAAEMAAFANSDDREGCLFTVTVQRKEIGGLVEPGIGSEKSSVKAEGSQKSSQKSSQKIIELMQSDPTITIADLAQSVGVTDRAIKKQIEKLKAQGQIRRIGPDKGGHWEVVE